MDAKKKEELKTSGKLEQIESRIIRQGLDLKGGMYIVLEADIPKLVENLASFKDESLIDIISSAKKTSLNPNLDFFTTFEKLVIDNDIKLSRYYYNYGSTIDEIINKLKEEADDAINRVLEILQNRVDQFGVSEPTIQKQGQHRIVVELAGIQDSKRARSLLQSTALLEFYLVKNMTITNEIITQLDAALSQDIDLNKNVSENINPIDDDDSKTNTVATELAKALGPDKEDNLQDSVKSDDVGNIFKESTFSNLLTALPGDMGIEEKNVYAFKKLLENEKIQAKIKNFNGQFLLSHEPQSITPDATEKYYRLYFLKNEPELTGGIVDEARADLGSLGGGSAGQPVVSLKMNNEGSKSWSRVTGANVGARIAIVLDKKVYMAPLIREKITDGQTQIEGFANINEAEDFANILTSGNYPNPVYIVEERLVSDLVEKIAGTTNNESISNNVDRKDNSSMWIGTFSGLCPEYNMKNKYGGDLIINGNRVPVPSTHYTFEIYDNNTCSIYMKDNNGKEYSCHNINYSVSSNSNSFSLSMKPETGSACGGNEIILFKRGSQFKIASGKSGFPEFIINKIK